MPSDLSLIGRRILLWFSVLFFGFAFYNWFSHLYANYRVWEDVNAAGFPLDFWDAQFAFWPLMIGLTILLASGTLALVWNIAKRSQPANEESFLVWVGSALATGFGWQLALAIAYVSAGFSSGGYLLLEVLQPAVPTAIGVTMLLTPVFARLWRTLKPRAASVQDEPSSLH